MGRRVLLLVTCVLSTLHTTRCAEGGQGDLRWGEWDSVSCYACGLASIDPETDEEGTYGIAPGEGKKMYNHSCDLMDHGVQGNYEAGGQELDPRSNYDIVWETLTHQNCTKVEVTNDDGTVTIKEGTTLQFVGIQPTASGIPLTTSTRSKFR